MRVLVGSREYAAGSIKTVAVILKEVKNLDGPPIDRAVAQGRR